jgi:flagellar protein FliT
VKPGYGGFAPQCAAGEGLLHYYEAIERASADMLLAAQRGDWDQVVKLEGACAVLISQLKCAAQTRPLASEQRKDRLRILQRIVLNDAQIRRLAEPGARDLEARLSPQSRTLH